MERYASLARCAKAVVKNMMQDSLEFFVLC